MPEETKKKRKVHESITDVRVMDAVEREMCSLDNPGFCLACGEEQDGCEPDARRYECEACGEKTVYGAAEVLMNGLFHIEVTSKPKGNSDATSDN